MSEDNIAFRLKLLLQKIGTSSSIFADTCGISRATFSQLLTGRNKKISDIIIGQIHKAYPGLSILWLLFNEGPMWIGEPGTQSDISNSSKEQIPDISNAIQSSAENLKVSNEGDLYSELRDSDSESKITSPMGGQNLNENLIFSSGKPGIQNDSKEKGLNTNKTIPHIINNQDIIPQNNSFQNGNEIEHKRIKPRKVVQVTIYYDDSTFETLFPR